MPLLEHHGEHAVARWVRLRDEAREIFGRDLLVRQVPLFTTRMTPQSYSLSVLGAMTNQGEKS